MEMLYWKLAFQEKCGVPPANLNIHTEAHAVRFITACERQRAAQDARSAILSFERAIRRKAQYEAQKAWDEQRAIEDRARDAEESRMLAEATAARILEELAQVKARQDSMDAIEAENETKAKFDQKIVNEGFKSAFVSVSKPISSNVAFRRAKKRKPTINDIPSICGHGYEFEDVHLACQINFETIDDEDRIDPEWVSFCRIPQKELEALHISPWFVSKMGGITPGMPYRSLR